MEANVLGQNIKQRRGHMSLAELADLANRMLPDLPPFELNAYYISDLEQGRNQKPNGLALLRLAAALDCKPEELYGPAPTQPAVVA